MRSIGAVLVRAVVIVVAMQLTGWLVVCLAPGPDANIGAGLLAFAAGALIAFLWALRDTRTVPTGPVLLRWLLTGALAALGFWAVGAVREPDAALSDLATVAPFIAAVVLVPALAGVALGATARTRPAPAPESNPEPQVDQTPAQ